MCTMCDVDACNANTTCRRKPENTAGEIMHCDSCGKMLYHGLIYYALLDKDICPDCLNKLKVASATCDMCKVYDDYCDCYRIDGKIICEERV